MREDGIPQFTVDGHRPVRDFDLFGISFSTELGYTNLLNALDLAGIPLHAVDRGDDDPVVIAGGHAAFNPEPIADFVDAAVLGDGEEIVLAISEVVREWKRARDGPGGPRRAAAAARGLAERLRPEVLRRHLRRRRHHRGRRPQQARHPVPGPQAHADGPRRVALPRQAAGAARRDRARAVQRRDLPRLHARLPLLPGRHDHPPGARAVDRDDRRDGRERHPPVRLRGGRAAVAVERRPHRDRRGGPRPRRPLRGHQRLAVAAQHPGRRLQHHPGQRVLPQRPSLRAHLRARGRQRADAEGDQQGRRRGRPDPHRRDGVLPRLAAGEALLHVRPARPRPTRTCSRSPTSPRR